MNFRCSLFPAPAARNDGSGMVDHQITAEYEVESGSWATVPARNKTFCVPADELAVVMAKTNTGAKVTAYKQLLADNIGTQPSPVTGWALAQLQEMYTANEAAASAAADADDYITNTLHQNYPVAFTI